MSGTLWKSAQSQIDRHMARRINIAKVWVADRNRWDDSGENIFNLIMDNMINYTVVSKH